MSTPVFWEYFDRQPSGSFATTSELSGASVAVGDGRLYVASKGADRVYMYDAETMAYLGAVSIQSPVGVASYRGELFVANNPGFSGQPSRVNVYEPDGTFSRSFSVNTYSAVENDEWHLHSLDVAWGEAWTVLTRENPAWYQTNSPYLPPAHVRIFDAATGGLKRIVPLAGRFHCEPPNPDQGPPPHPNPPNPYSWDDGQCPQTNVAPAQAWWLDIAISPELNRGIVNRDRAVRRGPLGLVPLQDVVTDEYNPELDVFNTECPEGPGSAGLCEHYSEYEGEDAVWGMKRLLTVAGKRRFGQPEVLPRGQWIQEYGLGERTQQTLSTNAPAADSALQSLAPGWTSQLTLSLQRKWQPMQAQTDTIRDVVYHPHPTAIVWSGPLTRRDWNRATQTLPYVVSNADAFVVGARGERWLEPDRSTTTVELWIDGIRRAVNSGPIGQFSVDTTTLSNGEHTLEVVAHLNSGAEVRRTNTFRVDNAAPAGELVEPENYLWGRVPIIGTFSDSHSGTANWQLEVQRAGNNYWQEPCIQPRTAPDLETGYYRCDWNTDNGVFPDGTYSIRARLTDKAIDGGNVRYTQVWADIEVRNHVPHEGPGPGIHHPPQQPHEELPETFSEAPAPDTPPDDAEGEESASTSDLQCPANEEFFEVIQRDYVLVEGLPIGFATPEMALLEFLTIPPRIPFALFSVETQTPGFVSYVSREFGSIRAQAYVLQAEDGSWLVGELIGCGSYFDQFEVGLPVPPTTGNQAVDDAIEAAQQLGGFGP